MIALLIDTQQGFSFLFCIVLQDYFSFLFSVYLVILSKGQNYLVCSQEVRSF